MKLPIFNKPALPRRYLFATTMKCQACVDHLAKTFGADPKIGSWQVGMESKPLVLDITTMYQPEAMLKLIQKAGYQGEFLEELPLFPNPEA